MIPREHPEVIWSEDEASPLPVEEPASWRAWSRLFRIVGVVVPLVASFAYAFIDPLLLVTIWISFFLGFVCGGLLRSWWAILIVPTVFIMGILLSSIFLGDGMFQTIMADPFFAGGWVYGFLVMFGVVPISIGAAIGTPIGMIIERLLQQ